MLLDFGLQLRGSRWPSGLGSSFELSDQDPSLGSGHSSCAAD